ncbi:MAG TPA: phage holin family protein [Gaiellaceae bacterium]|jgi:putative membrane protein
MRLLVTLGANALALYLANRLFGGVRIHGTWAYVIGAAALGFANAFLKPLLTILTLPLVLVTLGFFYLVINIAMVAFAAWVAPHFTVHGFWTYVGTVAVIWVVNLAIEGIADRALDG